MSNIFEYSEKVRTYEATLDGSMSPLTALNYFQEAAQRQLESLDIGFDTMSAKGFAWLLVKYEIDFYSYPRINQDIIIETEPTSFNRFEAYRRFAIKTTSGETLVEGKSVWVLANTETKRLVRINSVEELERLLKNDGEQFKIKKLANLEEPDSVHPYIVDYLDIDINHHANNVNYLGWAINSLPFEILVNKEISKLVIIYKEQAVLGEEILVQVKVEHDDLIRVDVCNSEGKVLCQLELELRNRKEKVEISAPV